MSTGLPVEVAPTPEAPKPSGGPDPAWAHAALYRRVIQAIYSLPAHFETTLNIEGVQATDLFTLNTPLGASIERSMVDCLNDLRELWDPDKRYGAYAFVRHSQAFPDVRFQTEAPDIEPEDRVLMGIELKGWFVLSKEGEPSFRYAVSPAVCAPQDLLVIVPWSFKNVISGAPMLLKPIVVEARYAAQMRNHHWQYLRDTSDPVEQRGVTPAQHQRPYPGKAAKISDIPIRDGGGNFGRVARVNVINEAVDATLRDFAAGISLRHWHQFISIFTGSATHESVSLEMTRLADALDLRLKFSDAQKRRLQEAFASISAVLAEVHEAPPVAAKSARVTRRG